MFSWSSLKAALKAALLFVIVLFTRASSGVSVLLTLVNSCLNAVGEPHIDGEPGNLVFRIRQLK